MSEPVIIDVEHEETEEVLRDKVQVLEKQVLRLFERQEELLVYYRELGSSLVEYFKENDEDEQLLKTAYAQIFSRVIFKTLSLQTTIYYDCQS